MNESEFRAHCATLGVEPNITADGLRQFYLQKSFALIRSGASAEEKERCRLAQAALTKHFDDLASAQQAATRAVVQAGTPREVAEALRLMREEVEQKPFALAAFDNLWVNAIVPPVVALLGVLVMESPFAFFLMGFNIWVHEFGHATIAWLTGHRALPLPIGWTNYSPEKSNFVYFGILALLTVLFLAGLKERKPAAMFIAIGVAIVQYYMTWKMPDRTVTLWLAFCGVGGEFYLSAAMIGMFYVELPEKFRWGLCRYFFLFIGAGSFHRTFMLWRQIHRGEADIPMGSMVNGEDDAGGDMNILHEDYDWTLRGISHTYNNLGTACLIAIVVVYLIFALGLNRLPALVAERWLKEEV
jgi:hypothetical protein